ncbi:MAG: hypothetical protein ACN6O7_22105 [Sphingobacterium sp.]
MVYSYRVNGVRGIANLSKIGEWLVFLVRCFIPGNVLNFRQGYSVNVFAIVERQCSKKRQRKDGIKRHLSIGITFRSYRTNQLSAWLTYCFFAQYEFGHPGLQAFEVFEF